MEIKVNKCETCGALIEDDAKYKKHLNKHNLINVINKAFPLVKDENCRFANGGWSVQRTKEWLDKYRHTIVEAVVNDYEPWSYGWFRCLDDSHDKLYPLAVRATCICEECYREWGQPYHTIHCNHKDKSKD